MRPKDTMKIAIQTAQAFRLSNLQKVGDHYETTVTSYQYFYGQRADGSIYKDGTTKTFRIMVKSEEVEGENAVVARFGDMEITETTP
jgi:hypothetical protein